MQTIEIKGVWLIKATAHNGNHLQVLVELPDGTHKVAIEETADEGPISHYVHPAGILAAPARAFDEQQPATGHPVLDLAMDQNDADAATIRDYLTKLLAGVWEHGEGFNGKRPFGNSGWEHELYLPLIRAGLVNGNLDEDSYIEYVDHRAADQVIADAIRELGTRR